MWCVLQIRGYASAAPAVAAAPRMKKFTIYRWVCMQ